MKARVTFEIGAASATQFPQPDVPEVAFIGRSNVGKSSLLNALTGSRAIARVSATPGKTQQINFYDIDGRLRFVDLPGYGYARASKDDRRAWGRVADAYLGGDRPLALVLLLIDARLPLQDIDGRMLGALLDAGLPVQVVLTKIDKLNQSERSRQERDLTRAMADIGYTGRLAGISSVKGTGMKALLDSILGVAAATSAPGSTRGDDHD